MTHLYTCVNPYIIYMHIYAYKDVPDTYARKWHNIDTDTCIGTCTLLHMHTGMCTCTNTHEHTYIHMHTYTQCTHMHTYAHTCTYIHMHTHTHKHTLHIHTHTHAHTHTHQNKSRCQSQTWLNCTKLLVWFKSMSASKPSFSSSLWKAIAINDSCEFDL